MKASLFLERSPSPVEPEPQSDPMNWKTRKLDWEKSQKSGRKARNQLNATSERADTIYMYILGGEVSHHLAHLGAHALRGRVVFVTNAVEAGEGEVVAKKKPPKTVKACLAFIPTHVTIPTCGRSTLKVPHRVNRRRLKELCLRHPPSSP